MLSFSGLVFLIDALVLIIFSYKLWQVKIKKPKDAINRIFFNTIFLLTIAFLIFAINVLFFSDNPYWLSRLKVIGDAVMYISFAYGVQLPFAIKWPNMNSNIFFENLLGIAVIASVINIISLPEPFLSQTGIIYWNLNEFSAWALYAAAIIMWLPTGYIFISEGRKLPRPKKDQYYLLGVSFVLISLFGPLMVVVRQDFLVALSQIIMTIGYAFLAVGMYVNKE